ncbi:F-type H+-transporting ATPase subunit delta [Catenuloplanes atrovinosus]|uniref:ATP synthase subunit delta n=2 Tax=Catenuloplanes atrovinosus TaxID=137266 RepID=A0AAE3YWF8_9ACTN|nr:F-type H+-transporting ATPase subunit delta [Catenuloplanes atrovinosus]
MSIGNRESYAAATDELTAYASTASAADVAALGDELLAVARLLSGEPRLRRALSDSSTTVEQRTELAGALLTGKVAASTLRVVTALVGARWHSPSEFLTAVEQTGVNALLSSASAAGELTEVEDELFRFGKVVAGDQALGGALGDTSVPAARRTELVRELLAGKAKPVTVRLVEVALSGFGGRGFAASLDRLIELAADRQDRDLAYVTVARPLAEADEAALAAKLSELYGRDVSLKVTVDPAIIGGISVRVGSDLYDGTILRRLTEARKAFAK